MNWAKPQIKMVEIGSKDLPERIPLSGIPRALIAAGFTDRPVGYNRLYRLIVSGAIPAQQTMTNRWSVQSRDLPFVASVLGL